MEAEKQSIKELPFGETWKQHSSPALLGLPTRIKMSDKDEIQALVADQAGLEDHYVMYGSLTRIEKAYYDYIDYRLRGGRRQ